MNQDVFTHYKTGLKSLDDKHLAILSALTDAGRAYQKTDFDTCDKQLDLTLALLIEEVEWEGKEMDLQDYPYKQEHAADHDKLIKKLQLVIQMIKSHPQYMSIFYVVSEWQSAFLDHIDNHDVQWILFNQRNK